MAAGGQGSAWDVVTARVAVPMATAAVITVRTENLIGLRTAFWCCAGIFAALGMWCLRGLVTRHHGRHQKVRPSPQKEREARGATHGAQDPASRHPAGSGSP